MLQLTRLAESQTRLTQIWPYSNCPDRDLAHIWAAGDVVLSAHAHMGWPLEQQLRSGQDETYLLPPCTNQPHVNKDNRCTASVLAKDASYNVPASRRGHSRVNAFNTRKQEVIIISCVPCYDSYIMNLLLWSAALTCTFGTTSDTQVDTWMVFSFYFSVSRVLRGKGATDKKSTSGLCLKTCHRNRIHSHLQDTVYGFSISWASFWPCCHIRAHFPDSSRLHSS